MDNYHHNLFIICWSLFKFSSFELRDYMHHLLSWHYCPWPSLVFLQNSFLGAFYTWCVNWTKYKQSWFVWEDLKYSTESIELIRCKLEYSFYFQDVIIYFLLLIKNKKCQFQLKDHLGKTWIFFYNVKFWWNFYLRI